MAEVTGKTVTSNFLWRFFERVGAQGVAFVVSLVLARFLAPAAYGEVALITVFTGIIGIFINSGFSYALVQKKNADDLDYSSVFYFNVVMCVSIYIIMFICAPFIADFYEMPDLTPVIRVQSIAFLISGVKSVQGAFVSKHLMFKKFFFATLGGTVGAGIIGIVMAVSGFGVWALVVQDLFNNFVDTVILWVTVKWRPKLMFSFQRLKGLFSFGWKILVSELLDTGYNKLRQLIIGKVYTSSDLAYYNKGHTFPEMITSNINTSINSVLFSSMAAVQDDKDEVRKITRRSVKVSTFLLMPCMMGLAVCAEPIIRILITDKWIDAVPYLRCFCFSYAFWPIQTSNLNAIKAMGRSDIFLKLEILKKIIGVALILATVWISPFALAMSVLASSITSQIINSFPNKKLLNYSYLAQLKDMLPSLLLTGVMGAIVYCINFLGLNDWLTLAIQVPLGVIIYIVGAKITKNDSLDYSWELVKSFLKKN